MKYLVFAVYDRKAEAYGMPIFFAAKGQAVRAFDDQCNQAGSMMNLHPQDYTLYQIGEYTDSDGLMVPLTSPVGFGTGVDYLKQPPLPMEEPIVSANNGTL